MWILTQVSPAWCGLLSTISMSSVGPNSLQLLWLIWIWSFLQVWMFGWCLNGWTSCACACCESSLWLIGRVISFSRPIRDKWHSELLSSNGRWMLNWMSCSLVSSCSMVAISCSVSELAHLLLGVTFFAPMTWFAWLWLLRLHVGDHEILIISKVYFSLETCEVDFKLDFLLFLLWFKLLLRCLPSRVDLLWNWIWSTVLLGGFSTDLFDLIHLLLHVVRQRHIVLSRVTSSFLCEQLFRSILTNWLRLSVIWKRDECIVVCLDACLEEVFFCLFSSKAQFVFKVHDLALKRLQFRFHCEWCGLLLVLKAIVLISDSKLCSHLLETKRSGWMSTWLKRFCRHGGQATLRWVIIERLLLHKLLEAVSNRNVCRLFRNLLSFWLL